METPAIKKRRLNIATVNKPFRSPFRAPLKTEDSTAAKVVEPTASPVKQDRRDVTSIAAGEVHSDPPPHTLDKTSIHESDRATRSSPQPTPLPRRHRPSQKPFRSSLSSTTVSTPSDRTTRTAILEVKQDIDTLTQALRIMNKNTDVELEELVLKWRAASRAAAEEMFGTVRDRVNRMGGVGAWREAEKKKQSRMGGWDEPEAEAPVNDDSDTDPEDSDEDDSDTSSKPKVDKSDRPPKPSKAEIAAMKKERKEAIEAEIAAEAGAAGADRKKAVWEEDGGDDDSFTMDMMLRTLNVDLHLIGYSKEGQRWVG